MFSLENAKELADEVGLVVGGKDTETCLSTLALCVAAELRVSFKTEEDWSFILDSFKHSVLVMLRGPAQ